MNVCRIHELFLLPAVDRHPATAFLTMEYLDGVTLAHRIEHAGPIPWKEALGIALDVCEGLRLIHQQGIIHRDLKSANIMLCERGGTVRAVLMDFGLALDASLKISAPEGTTETEMPAGTLPEQSLVPLPIWRLSNLRASLYLQLPTFTPWELSCTRS